MLALPGRYREAAESYETAVAQGAASGAVERKLGNLHHRLGEWEPAERHFSAAAANGEHDAERSQLHSDWSLTALHRGDGDRALALAREALALADAAGEPGALAQAHNMLGLLALSRGDTDEAQAALRRSLELAERARDTTARVAAQQPGADTLRGRRAGEDAGAPTQQALGLYLLRAGGRSEEAESHVRRGAEILAQVGADEGLRRPEIWKLRRG